MILRTIRRAKWYRNPDVEWLEDGELQADALGDLTTSANRLSVFLIKPDRSNLERVLTALAAKREYLANVDYALLDAEHLSSLAISVCTCEGNTPDAEVNGCHRDLEKLTAQKVLALADAILRHGELSRVPYRKVAHWIATALDAGHIDAASLTTDVLSRVVGH